MTRPTTILLVSEDPDLRAEWQAAEAGTTEVRVLAHFADSRRDALRLARSQQPDAVCLGTSPDPVAIETWVAELQEAAPNARFVGILDRRLFASGDAEAAFLVAATRAGLRDFLRRPLSSTELGACLRRSTDADRQVAARPSQAGRITVFISNKGGVGKTTLAVNVACELARRAPGTVLLVDAALQLGLCATMLDLEPTITMHDAVTQMERLDATLLRELTVAHDSGLHLLAAPTDAVDAAGVREEHLSRILAVARSAYDHVIVDTFPILDGIAIAAFDRADEVWQVVAPTVPAVLGAERFCGLLEGVGVEPSRQRICVNTQVPGHAGQLSPRDIADRLDRRIDVVVPFRRAVVAACNSGRPVALTAPRWNGFRRRITEIADRIEAGAAEPTERSLE